MLLLFVAAAKAVAELGHRLGKLQDFCPVRGSDGFVWGQDGVFCLQLFSVPPAGRWLLQLSHIHPRARRDISQVLRVRFTAAKARAARSVRCMLESCSMSWKIHLQVLISK